MIADVSLWLLYLSSSRCSGRQLTGSLARRVGPSLQRAWEDRVGHDRGGGEIIESFAVQPTPRPEVQGQSDEHPAVLRRSAADGQRCGQLVGKLVESGVGGAPQERVQGGDRGPVAVDPLGHRRGLAVPAEILEQHAPEPVGRLVVCQRGGQVGQRGTQPQRGARTPRPAVAGCIEEAAGRVGAYFGTFFDAIQRVFLTPAELRLTDTTST